MDLNLPKSVLSGTRPKPLLERGKTRNLLIDARRVFQIKKLNCRILLSIARMIHAASAAIVQPLLRMGFVWRAVSKWLRLDRKSGLRCTRSALSN